MVPRDEEPPEVSLTNQVTAVFCVPVTVAEKVAELPARTLAVCGVTLTEMVAGGGGCCELEEPVAPQAARRKGTRRRARKPGRLGVGTCIYSDFGAVRTGGLLDFGTEKGRRGRGTGRSKERDLKITQRFAEKREEKRRKEGR